MNKDFFSDGVLVYDRYYCTKPHTPLLVIKRILLAVTFCVSSIMYILSQFGFPVDLTAMAVVCGISCAVFSGILVFVRKRWLLVGITVVFGLLTWLNFGLLRDKLSYFADACMLLVEGRFLYPRRYLFHRNEILDAYNPDFVAGVVLGTVLMCLMYSLIVSLCFSGRLRPLIPALLFTTLCVPVLFSERIEFGFWLIPALASLAGAFAIRRNYSGGLAVRHSSLDDYRRRMKMEERSFLKHTSSAPFAKRTEMHCNYYSKYFSSGMYCATITAVCLLIGAAIIPDGGKIDYSGLYSFVSNLTENGDGVESPFDNGSASEYFTHSGTEQEDLLNIVSPGRGEREMIRVSYQGSRPFYLRGDVGVDFTGRSWTTVVGSEPGLWSASGLKDTYRPCENRVIEALLGASSDGSLYSAVDGEKLIASDYVSIEYLCSTDVVFLPPYTVDYSFYNNELFNVYGDYAVRVSEIAGSHINSVDCVALIPSYTSNELYSGDADGLAEVERLFELNSCTPNDIYSSVVPEMEQEDILSSYSSYVDSTYLSIPDNYVQEIESYIRRCLYDEYESLADQRNSGSISEVQYRYQLATVVADYLRTNYTYSLDGSNNSHEPVLQFLNETKRGHCSLYASAMTLILRELGVPARYCTGFYVESADGSNSVLLREKNLHAWTEVYLGQYGWVTFDPTSSAAYPGRGNAAVGTVQASAEQPTVDSAEQSDSTEPSQETPDQTSETKHTGESDTSIIPVSTADVSAATGEGNSDSEFPGNAAAILPYIIAAVAALVIAAMILLRLCSIRKSALSELERLKAGGGKSGELLSLLLALLERGGLRPGRGELPGAFWKRVDENLGTSLEEESALIEAMEFGSYEITDEENARLYKQLQIVVDSMRTFSFPWKIGVMKLITEICHGAQK